MPRTDSTRFHAWGRSARDRMSCGELSNTMASWKNLHVPHRVHKLWNSHVLKDPFLLHPSGKASWSQVLLRQQASASLLSSRRCSAVGCFELRHIVVSESRGTTIFHSNTLILNIIWTPKMVPLISGNHHISFINRAWNEALDVQ